MAQDLVAAFHVGSNAKTIFQIDGDGLEGKERLG